MLHKSSLVPIDPLHGDVIFGYFCIRPFSLCHVGGQKCIVVIERKALNVLLFTNANDYPIRLAWKGLCACILQIL